MKKKYKNILKKLYAQIPFKQYLFVLAKKAGISKYNIYKKLTFTGKYVVRIGSKKITIINTGGSIENEIFWKGAGSSWEPETFWIWELLSEKSNVIFDVGANTGIYSLIAKTINPSAKVIAFEPSVKTYDTLLKNCKINNYDIVAEKIALSNVTGHSVFYDVFEANQTSASLSPDKLKNFSGYKGQVNEYSVSTMTLDDYIEKNNISKIDLMKIDVELHEPEVIDGFRKFLLTYCPVIIIEVLTGEVADKLNALFNNTGYLMYHLDSHNKMTKVDKLAVIPHKWNFLLCPRQKADELRLGNYLAD